MSALGLALRFAAAAALLAALALEPARAQGSRAVFRLGGLAQSALSQESVRKFTLPELERFGFVEGRNLTIEERVGAAEQLPGLARDLVALKPDAIVAIASNAIAAAREATDTIPIVVYGGNPVALGLATDLPRPGGNVTGVVILSAELDVKRLQLLHEVALFRRVAALVHRSQLLSDLSLRAMRAAAAQFGSELLVYEVSGRPEYPAAFAAMRDAGVQGVVILAYAQFFFDADVLTELALAARLATSCEWREMAQRGCLIGYGPDRAQLYRRVADYAARIFKGAAPGALPIEQPTKFELAVNLKTARALGLTVPEPLLVGADEVIE